MNVVLGITDARYEELVKIFVDWWDQAKVLDGDALKDYSRIYEKYRSSELFKDMPWAMDEAKELEREIRELKKRLRDRELALPAHSIRPHQLLIIEALEEEIQEKQKRLAALRKV